MTGRRARVLVGAGAETDLHGIWRRRLEQRGSEGEDGADALLDRLVRAIESLAEHPERGPLPPELDALGMRDFRQLSLTPFRVIYHVESGGAEVVTTVLIVADARRDFRELLEERLLRTPPAGR